MFIIWWIIVGLIAGFITGKLMKGSGYGAIGDIVIGIIGAILGGFIMRAVGFTGQGGMIYTILVAIAGAVILTLLLRLITGNRARNLEPGLSEWPVIPCHSPPHRIQSPPTPRQIASKSNKQMS
jgi:uncharacterized membrane protein YeaQ/YmgE (transglycosylase-associated protein family)